MLQLQSALGVVAGSAAYALASRQFRWEGFINAEDTANHMIGGILMVTSRNAVVAACWLIFAFLAAAGIFALLAAPFVAILQILIYAGAIMMLYVFVIMLINVRESMAERQWQRQARFLRNKGYDAATILRVLKESGLELDEE